MMAKINQSINHTQIYSVAMPKSRSRTQMSKNTHERALNWQLSTGMTVPLFTQHKFEYNTSYNSTEVLTCSYYNQLFIPQANNDVNTLTNFKHGIQTHPKHMLLLKLTPWARSPPCHVNRSRSRLNSNSNTLLHHSCLHAAPHRPSASLHQH
jgi:hypothetical protein